MQSIDVLGKLLAQENITIVRGKYRTASFDLKDRVLRLPILKDVEPAEEALFMYHEVAHALFTTIDSYLEFVTKGKELGCKNFSSYMNIVEDARIERMMRERFPGTRKEFFAAYKSLHLGRDFFGVLNRNLNTLPLIDRVNLHFKLGIMARIRFSEEEMQIVNQIEAAQTLADVFAAAQAMYTLGRKEQAQIADEHNMLSEGESESDDMFDDVDPGDPDELGGEDLSESETASGLGEDDSEGSDDSEAPMSSTQEQFDKNLRQVTDSGESANIQVKYAESGHYEYDNRIIPHKEIYSILSASKQTNLYEETRPIVSFMLKEFEMRRSADRYSRETVARSGSIDLKKIHAYKTAKDIFRTYSVITDDQNHSMLMLLDWSGSMSNVYRDNMEQVIALAMFCRAAKIPFQVFAFASRKHWFNNRATKLPMESVKSTPEAYTFGETARRSFFLLELFSSKMSSGEFRTAVNLAPRIIGIYGLHQTPLNASLVDIRNYLPKFKELFPAQKHNLIVVTDGASETVQFFDIRPEVNTFLFSEKINRRFFVNRYSGHIQDKDNMTNALMSLIRAENPDLTSTMFYVGKPHTLNSYFNLDFETKKSLSETGTSVVKIPGFDRGYLMRVERTRETTFEEDFSKVERVTANRAAKALGKVVGGSKSQRLMMSKFLEFVA